MKPAEAKEVYVECCKAKRRAAEQGEANLWAKEFALVDAVDLRAGFESWCRDTTPTGNGEPRGKFWPQPLELKPHVLAAQRRRYSQVSSDLDFVVWKCPVCNVTRSGWPQDSTYRRNCMNWDRKSGGRCGAIMKEFLREPAGSQSESGERAA